MASERTIIAIDLKSFYASVECVDRGLDPLTTNLVVADASRTNKTICLAVTPSLKAYGISGRARLFEVEQRVDQINMERLCYSPDGDFHGSSTHDPDIQANPSLALSYIVAPPRMGFYIKYSTAVNAIYLKYFDQHDIHVYSIDEVFIDATNYMATYRMSARELTTKILREVFQKTGITATAGIGTNIYLAKVAMDIVAKHVPSDANGVRIAELNEMEYRRQLWCHQPLTDFWLIGRGTAKRLEANGMYTMGDVAKRSTTDTAIFSKLFGIKGEMIVDHAWGWEPVTMEAIKGYTPQSHSLSSGQVLGEPYTFDKTRIVVREMADNISLKLVGNNQLTDNLSLFINYDTTSLEIDGHPFEGDISVDYYGRPAPAPAHGSIAFPRPTSSTREICDAAEKLFNSIVNPDLLVRRINIAVNIAEQKQPKGMQLGLFDNPEEIERQQAEQEAAYQREQRMQKATLEIKKRFGKNAILRGINFEQGATARERNRQIGGHKE